MRDVLVNAVFPAVVKLQIKDSSSDVVLVRQHFSKVLTEELQCISVLETEPFTELLAHHKFGERSFDWNRVLIEFIDLDEFVAQSPAQLFDKVPEVEGSPANCHEESPELCRSRFFYCFTVY